MTKKRKKKQPLQKPDPKQRYSEEVAQLLPLPVSGISVQKKNKYRYSVFVDDKFLVGISDSTLTKFNLTKGVLMTPLLLQDIINAENTWKIREYLIGLLSRRDHARSELKAKALKKEYPAQEIESILDELEEKGYINNRAFARKFVHDKFEFNKWGINKIRIELIKKGISESDITLALSELDDSEVLETIRHLVEKNKRKFLRADPLKRKKKVFDFLLRKGYDSNSIMKSISSLMELIES